MKAYEEALKVEDYLVEMRRHFHKYPELSWEEHKTSEKICEELDKMEIEYERVIDTGVIATIKGSKDKPVIGIRADIDALPVLEDTNLEFKSCNEGVMHACGHDAHIAMLLGTAKVLKDNIDKLDCTVKLIFQPAEEFIQDSGAKHMVKLEQVKDIDNIVAAHIWSLIDTGKISVDEGPRMASADTFKIVVKGKGGHGALPHETVDPILVASSLVNNLQSLASREQSPMDTFVLSICSLNSGSSANIIPDEAILEGTSRSFNNEIRDNLPEKMERIIKSTCKTFRADYDFEYYYGTPATINDSFSSSIAEKAVINSLGKSAIQEYPASMVGEDFAKFLNIIPGCLAFVGGRNEENSQDYPHHNQKFDIDEKAMKNGVSFFVQYVLEMQKELANKI